jgi:hypothetical protein
LILANHRKAHGKFISNRVNIGNDVCCQSVVIANLGGFSTDVDGDSTFRVLWSASLAPVVETGPGSAGEASTGKRNRKG